ncbi:hypothetical protein GCM10027278_02520 [Paralcaligenes ginsengisoli]
MSVGPQAADSTFVNGSAVNFEIRFMEVFLFVMEKFDVANKWAYISGNPQ